MKGIIIFLLVIIVAIMGYNQYQKYQRFHPKNVSYVTEDTIDTSYYDPKVVQRYYEAIEALNGYVIYQWATNRMDVRNPKKDNEETQFAVAEYQKKRGQVQYYESILKQSATYKAKGYTNEEIQRFEQNRLTKEAAETQAVKVAFHKLFEKVLLKKTRKTGDQGPWVYELQKLLTTAGYTIAVDGKFRIETQTALKDFEAKHQLYADGVLDALTLSKLLKSTHDSSNPLVAGE